MDSQLNESGAFVDLYSSRRFCIHVLELLLSGKPFGWVTIDKPGAADVAIEDTAIAWKAVRKRSVTDLLSTGFIGQKGDKGIEQGHWDDAVSAVWRALGGTRGWEQGHWDVEEGEYHGGRRNEMYICVKKR